MPIYEYTCETCGHTFDHLARTLTDHARTCPKCGKAKLRKGLSSFAPRMATAASRACDRCSTNPTCPHAGAGCGCH